MRHRFSRRALLAAALTCNAPLASGQVLSEWLSPVDGNWNDAANWSTPAFPNNGGGTTYDVLIAAGGLSDYDVTLLSQPIMLDALTLNDSRATLFITNAEITAGTIDVMAGTLETFNTTVHSNLLTSSAGGAPITWRTTSQPTVLDIARFSHSVNFEAPGQVHFMSDLQLDDGITIDMQPGTILLDGASISTPGQVTINLSGQPFRASNTSASVAEVGAGVNLEFIGGGNRIIGWIDHYGVIRADSDQNNGTILGRSTSNPFTNYGTIEALNDATIWIGDQRNTRGFVNAGTLRAENGGKVNFWGDVLFEAGTQLVGDGEFELIYGRLDLNGQTIDLDAVGSFTVLEGTLANGTFTGTGNSVLAASDDKMVFEAMTFGVDVLVNANTHDVSGGLTFAGGAEMRTLTNGAVRLRFTEAQTVDGNGRFLFAGDNGLSELSMSHASGDVVFESGISIEALGGNGQIGESGKSWINRGTILAGAGRTMTLAGNWDNQGTLRIQDGGTMVLDGEYTLAGAGVVDNLGGTLILDGTFDNLGQVTDFTGTAGSLVRLGSEARVLGGSLASSQGLALEISQRAFLEGVTFDMEVAIANRIAAVDSLTINNSFALISGVNASNGRLTLGDEVGDGVTHLDGTGVITITQSPVSPNARDVEITSFNSTLEIGSDLSIVMDDPLLSLLIGNDGNFNLHGTLDLSAGRTRLRSVWSSDGVIRTSGSAFLTLQGFYTTASLMTIDYQGGTVILGGGVLDNTGDVLRVDASTAWLGQAPYDFSNGFTLVGGRVESGDGLALTDVRHLDGVTLAGDLWLRPESGSTINNGLVFDGGTLHVAADQLFLQSGEFTGNGMIKFEVSNINLPDISFVNLPSGAILPVGLAVSTGGASGEFGTATTSNSWTNNGTLQSFIAGRDLRMTGDLAHQGTAHAANGGSLTFEQVTNHGSLLAEDGGVVVLESGWANPAGTIAAQSGGVIQLESWSATPGTIMLEDSILRLDFDTDLTLLAALPAGTNSVVQAARDFDLNGGAFDPGTLSLEFALAGGTLRSGSVVGPAALQVVNNAPAGDSTLDSVAIHTDMVVSDAGTTRLQNNVAFHGSEILGDGVLRVLTGHTASFDAVAFESAAVVDAGATLVVTNGLQLEGTIASGGASGARPQVRFNGTQQVAGSGAFESTTAQGLNLRFTGDLTLGQDINVRALQGILSFNGAGQALTLNGGLEVAAARTAIANVGDFVNHGDITVNTGGTLQVNADTITNHGVIELRNSTLRAIDTDIHNAVGSTVIVPGNVDLGLDGTFHVAGNLRGTGASNSRLFVLGHLTLEDSAQAEVSLVDDRFDTLPFLHALGDIVLDGTFDIDSTSLTDIEAGHTQVLVLGETLSGTFDQVNGTQIGPDHYWHLDYQSDQVVVEVRLAGDATGDGLVGVEDLDLILANWGSSVTAANANAGEWTGDGLINNADLQVVLSHWGLATPPPDTNVPEPGTAALLGLILFAGTRRRREYRA